MKYLGKRWICVLSSSRFFPQQRTTFFDNKTTSTKNLLWLPKSSISLRQNINSFFYCRKTKIWHLNVSTLKLDLFWLSTIAHWMLKTFNNQWINQTIMERKKIFEPTTIHREFSTLWVHNLLLFFTDHSSMKKSRLTLWTIS